MATDHRTQTDDLYEILQVSPSADPDVIEAAYMRLTKKYGEDPSADVRERRRALDRAFAVLKDPEQRAAYDRSRGLADFSGKAAAAPAEQPATTPVRSTGIVICPRHPGVETALRCSRCETPICPRCMVQTPVGARCRDCARMVKSPIYTFSAGTALRAALVAIIGGVAMGLIWGFILLPFTVGWFSIFIGAGLGYAFTRGMNFATRRKRGPAIVAFAIAGIAIAWGMQFAFVPPRVALYGLVAVGVGIYFIWQELR